jgi:hypothetical protein
LKFHALFLFCAAGLLAFYGGDGRITLVPKRRFIGGGSPEGRWGWQRVEVELAGGEQWKRSARGNVSLESIDRLAFQFCFNAWDGPPFVIWMDGLSFE